MRVLFAGVEQRLDVIRHLLARLVARGSARSYYQIAVAGAPIDRPAINYVRGRIITVAFANRQVDRVSVTEQATGVYLEPVRDSIPRVVKPAADTAAARRARP